MRLVVRTTAACVAALAAHLIVACASTEDAVVTNPENEGGSAPVPEAGTSEDGGKAEPDTDAAPRDCSDDGFCHSVVPTNQTLRAVWGDGNGVIWAVSDQGAVLRQEQGTWNVHATSLGRLTAIWGSSPTDLWVGGEGTLFHGTGTSPGAMIFAPVAIPAGDVSVLWGTGAEDIWATVIGPVGSSHVLHYTKSDESPEASWLDVTPSVDGTDFEYVFGNAETGIWLIGSMVDPRILFRSSNVYRMPPGATEFAPIMAPPNGDDPPEPWNFGLLHSGAVVSNTTVILQGRTPSQEDGLITYGTSSNGGQTYDFRVEHDGLFGDLFTYAIAAFAPDDLWTFGEMGQIRHWTGTDWVTPAIAITKYPVVAPLYGVWAQGPSDFWVVGEGVALHHSKQH